MSKKERQTIEPIPKKELGPQDIFDEARYWEWLTSKQKEELQNKALELDLENQPDFQKIQEKVLKTIFQTPVFANREESKDRERFLGHFFNQVEYNKHYASLTKGDLSWKEVQKNVNSKKIFINQKRKELAEKQIPLLIYLNDHLKEFQETEVGQLKEIEKQLKKLSSSQIEEFLSDDQRLGGFVNNNEKKILKDVVCFLPKNQKQILDRELDSIKKQYKEQNFIKRITEPRISDHNFYRANLLKYYKASNIKDLLGKREFLKILAKQYFQYQTSLGPKNFSGAIPSIPSNHFELSDFAKVQKELDETIDLAVKEHLEKRKIRPTEEQYQKLFQFIKNRFLKQVALEGDEDDDQYFEQKRKKIKKKAITLAVLKLITSFSDGFLLFQSKNEVKAIEETITQSTEDQEERLFMEEAFTDENINTSPEELLQSVLVGSNIFQNLSPQEQQIIQQVVGREFLDKLEAIKNQNFSSLSDLTQQIEEQKREINQLINKLAHESENKKSLIKEANQSINDLVAQEHLIRADIKEEEKISEESAKLRWLAISEKLSSGVEDREKNKKTTSETIQDLSEEVRDELKALQEGESFNPRFSDAVVEVQDDSFFIYPSCEESFYPNQIYSHFNSKTLRLESVNTPKKPFSNPEFEASQFHSYISKAKTPLTKLSLPKGFIPKSNTVKFSQEEINYQILTDQWGFYYLAINNLPKEGLNFSVDIGKNEELKTLSPKEKEIYTQSILRGKQSPQTKRELFDKISQNSNKYKSPKTIVQAVKDYVNGSYIYTQGAHLNEQIKTKDLVETIENNLYVKHENKDWRMVDCEGGNLMGVAYLREKEIPAVLVVGRDFEVNGIYTGHAMSMYYDENQAKFIYEDFTPIKELGEIKTQHLNLDNNKVQKLQIKLKEAQKERQRQESIKKQEQKTLKEVDELSDTLENEAKILNNDLFLSHRLSNALQGVFDQWEAKFYKLQANILETDNPQQKESFQQELKGFIRQSLNEIQKGIKQTETKNQEVYRVYLEHYLARLEKLANLFPDNPEVKAMINEGAKVYQKQFITENHESLTKVVGFLPDERHIEIIESKESKTLYMIHRGKSFAKERIAQLAPNENILDFKTTPQGEHWMITTEIEKDGKKSFYYFKDGKRYGVDVEKETTPHLDYVNDHVLVSSEILSNGDVFILFHSNKSQTKDHLSATLLKNGKWEHTVLFLEEYSRRYNRLIVDKVGSSLCCIMSLTTHISNSLLYEPYPYFDEFNEDEKHKRFLVKPLLLVGLNMLIYQVREEKKHLLNLSSGTAVQLLEKGLCLVDYSRNKIFVNHKEEVLKDGELEEIKVKKILNFTEINGKNFLEVRGEGDNAIYLFYFDPEKGFQLVDKNNEGEPFDQIMYHKDRYGENRFAYVKNRNLIIDGKQVTNEEYSDIYNVTIDWKNGKWGFIGERLGPSKETDLIFRTNDEMLYIGRVSLTRDEHLLKIAKDLSSVVCYLPIIKNGSVYVNGVVLQKKEEKIGGSKWEKKVIENIVFDSSLYTSNMPDVTFDEGAVLLKNLLLGNLLTENQDRTISILQGHKKVFTGKRELFGLNEGREFNFMIAGSSQIAIVTKEKKNEKFETGDRIVNFFAHSSNGYFRDVPLKNVNLNVDEWDYCLDNGAMLFSFLDRNEKMTVKKQDGFVSQCYSIVTIQNGEVKRIPLLIDIKNILSVDNFQVSQDGSIYVFVTVKNNLEEKKKLITKNGLVIFKSNDSNDMFPSFMSSVKNNSSVYNWGHVYWSFLRETDQKRKHFIDGIQVSGDPIKGYIDDNFKKYYRDKDESIFNDEGVFFMSDSKASEFIKLVNGKEKKSLMMRQVIDKDVFLREIEGALAKVRQGESLKNNDIFLFLQNYCFYGSEILNYSKDLQNFLDNLLNDNYQYLFDVRISELSRINGLEILFNLKEIKNREEIIDKAQKHPWSKSALIFIKKKAINERYGLEGKLGFWTIIYQEIQKTQKNDDR